MRSRWMCGSALAAPVLAMLATPLMAASDRAEPLAAATPEAQSDGGAAALAAASERPTSVGDIIVTAQRRSELLQDVPLSIQAFSGRVLEAGGFRDLREIITLVPGASEGRGNAAGIRSYQIRGVSSFYGDATIAYYLDEAAYVIPNRNYAPVARSFDIERVEVLRGPQGTLYGLGAMGGSIRFISADPDLDNFRARGGAGLSDTAGGKANYFGDIALSVPIIEGKFAIRGVASYEKHGGFAESPSFPGDINSDEYKNFRGKALIRPVDELTIKLGYHRSDTSDNWGQNFATTDPAAFPRSPVKGRSRQVYDMGTGYVSYDAGAVLIESSTGYVDRRDRSTGPILLGPMAFQLDVIGDSTSFTQEVRLVSQHDGPWQWVVGGIYLSAQNLEDIVVTGGPPISAVSRFDSRSLAGFGEVSVGLLDDTLRPLIGLRYFRDVRRFTTQNRAPRPTPAFERREVFDSVNPRFNLSWQPSSDVNIYTNVARGFRSGTFNTAAAVATNPTEIDFAVAPDNIWSYEVGAKFSVVDRTLFLEVVGYRLDWKDIQLNYTVAGGIQVIRNAGDVRGTGVEFIANWRATPRLTLSASGNINNTEFVNIINPAAFRATPSIAVGKQVASVPRATYNLGASYELPLGSGGTALTLSANYSHADRQGDPGDNQGRLGGDQNLLRARAAVDFGRVVVSAFGENLTNESSPIQISGSGRTRTYPRVIGVDLAFDF